MFGLNGDKSIQDMISYKCIKSMLENQITSIELLGVNECDWDYY